MTGERRKRINIDLNNITHGDLWFARIVWLLVGLFVGHNFL